MNFFIVDVLKRYARNTVLMWTVLILIDVLSRHYLKEKGFLFGSVVSIGLVSLLSSTMMAQSRWLAFWRRTSESIRQFWTMIALVLFLNLILNYVCYFVSYKISGGGDLVFESYKPTSADLFWITLILISMNFATLVDYKLVQLNLTMRPAIQGIMFIGIYAWILLLFYIMVHTRLLGYAFVEVSLLLFFFFRNSFVLTSILPSSRNKAFIVSLCAVVFAVLTFYLTEKKKGDPSDLLGSLGPKKVWNFSESGFATVKSPNGLVEYFNNSKKLTSSQLLQVVAKLETLCPRGNSDYPAVIECFEKETIEDDACICADLKESELFQFLDSELEYAKLVGLLQARGLDVFSEELKQKIENISKIPGNLSPIALKTLAEHGKGKRKNARVRFLENKK